MSDEQAAELKACPFCGESDVDVASSHIVDADGRKKNAVYCNDCFSEGPPVSDGESAADAWNTRPIEDALRAENEKLNSAWDAQREVAEFLLRDSDALRAKVSELTRLLGEALAVTAHRIENEPDRLVRFAMRGVRAEFDLILQRALKGASL